MNFLKVFLSGLTLISALSTPAFATEQNFLADKDLFTVEQFENSFGVSIDENGVSLQQRRPPPHRRPPYGYTCYAVNEWHEHFRGHDAYSPRRAQARAMRICYRYSRRCFERGCTYY